MKNNDTYLSPSWKTQLGYAEQELPNRREECESRIHSDDLECIRRLTAASAVTRMSDYETDVRMRHKDGTYRWMHSRTAIFKNAAGEPTVLVGCNIDIAERKGLEAQTTRLERAAAVWQLLGGVAHELNNLLFALNGYLQLLRDKLSPENGAADDIEKIEAVVTRITLILQQVLDLTSTSARRPERCSVAGILTSILKQLGGDMQERIKIVLVRASDLPEILADAGQVSEAFSALMFNAVQAMLEAHGQGTLTVKTELSAVSDQPSAPAERWIEVRIQDDGPGIPPELQSKIFEPFFTTKPKDKAMGLGLWIARFNVMMLKGTVQVESEVGKGTTFIVRLPLSETAGPPSDQPG